MSVDDDPHDWYAPHTFHPESKVPQGYDLDRGRVLLKNVEYSTIACPECGTEARQGERGLPTCPGCGVICTTKKRPDHEVIYDPKSTGRVNTNGEFKE